MSERDNGGSAFPTSESLDRNGSVEQYKVGGMTLNQLAMGSYAVADAMLEARKS